MKVSSFRPKLHCHGVVLQKALSLGLPNTCMVIIIMQEPILSNGKGQKGKEWSLNLVMFVLWFLYIWWTYICLFFICHQLAQICLNKNDGRGSSPLWKCIAFYSSFQAIFFIDVYVFLNENQVEPAVGAALLAWNFFMKEAHK